MSVGEDDPHAALVEPPPVPPAVTDREERARASRRTRRLVWRAIANLVTVAILVACFLPDPGLPPLGDLPWDKAAHALAFAAFAFCWRRAGGSVVFVLLAGILLASATEVGQGLLLPHRSADWGDVAADLFGLLLGLAVPWPTERNVSETF